MTISYCSYEQWVQKENIPCYNLIETEGGFDMELSLSKNIRHFRKERHLTQEQLAEIMGVTLGAVCLQR